MLFQWFSTDTVSLPCSQVAISENKKKNVSNNNLGNKNATITI